MIKRLFVLVLLLASLSPLSAAKLKDITLRPGETVYVRFDTSGKRLRLAEAGTQPNPQAQVVFSLERDTAKKVVVLRVENKLAKDLAYRAEMRSTRLNLKSQAPVTPVVAGKLGIEKFPELVDELTAFDFAYSGYKPAPETPKQ
jgi:type II secretory pathway component GspD/PulD (secretin)